MLVWSRRVTNRESAKRIRDKREDQMILMSEKVHHLLLLCMLFRSSSSLRLPHSDIRTCIALVYCKYAVGIS